MNILRPLHLFHRWAGIALCAFFAAWFFSGIFMMYVEYPQLTRTERLQAAPALDFSSATLDPATAVARLRAGDFTLRGTPRANLPVTVADPTATITPSAVRLASILGRPAYAVSVSGGAQPRIIYADTGELLAPVTVPQAIAAAAAFAPGSTPAYIELAQSDQWSVSSALNAHRPLHRLALNDAAHTELYVSSTTGEVVRDSIRSERVLNYFAAVTHWLYPHALRRFPEGWSWFVNIIAGFGTVFAVSGLWVGVIRSRRRRPTVNSVQQRLIRRHYLIGLLFGIPLITFIFSGWMSMNPASLNPPRTPDKAEQLVFAGRPLTPSAFALPSSLPAEAAEAELRHYGGEAYYAVTRRDGRTTFLPGTAATPPFPAAEVPGQLATLAPKLRPGAPAPSIETLTAYDNYYYTRHPDRGDKPLPILRARFTDAEATWFHLDPASGRILDRSTTTNRLFRHLYNGLHSLDWWWLWSRRPLWDIVVISLSLGGLGLSMLGLTLGVRRLRAA